MPTPSAPRPSVPAEIRAWIAVGIVLFGQLVALVVLITRLQVATENNTNAIIEWKAVVQAVELRLRVMETEVALLKLRQDRQ